MGVINLGRVRGDPSTVNGIRADSTGNITITPPDVGAASNTNLLDNWYFADPVNQRGLAEYSGSSIIAIDQWILENCKLTIENGRIVLRRASEAPAYASIVQRFERMNILAGRIVTVSVLVEENGANQCYFTTLRFAESSGGIDIGPIRIYSIPHGMYFRAFLPDLETAVYLVAAKLELGDKQTLAHQDSSGNWVLNDPPPNKALELAKCQRYQVVYGSNDSLSFFGDSFAYRTDQVDVFVSPPVPMAKIPSVNLLSGSFLAFTQGTLIGESSRFIVFSPDSRVTNFSIRLTDFSTQLTTNNVYEIYLKTGSVLVLDANL